MVRCNPRSPNGNSSAGDCATATQNLIHNKQCLSGMLLERMAHTQMLLMLENINNEDQYLTPTPNPRFP